MRQEVLPRQLGSSLQRRTSPLHRREFVLAPGWRPHSRSSESGVCSTSGEWWTSGVSLSYLGVVIMVNCVFCLGSLYLLLFLFVTKSYSPRDQSKFTGTTDTPLRHWDVNSPFSFRRSSGLRFLVYLVGSPLFVVGRTDNF